MISRILLPIDVGHESSWRKALPMAAHLARGGGEVHVLGIVHDVGSAWVASALPKNFERDAVREMEAQLESFVAEHAPEGLDARTHVSMGHVPQRILSVAEEIGADLIVMASYAPDELRSLLVGSNAGKVVRHSPISVLVVR